jgi:probable phosphoglycerate mutase
MRLIFIRHGEPNYEKDCLTELGHIQAKLVAQRLLQEDIKTIYSSPLGRARQTAQAYLDACGRTDVHILDFMKEIRFGTEEVLYDERFNPWTGVNKLIEQGINLQDPEWREFPLFKNNTATVDVDLIAAQSDKWLSSFGYEKDGLYYLNKNTEENNDTYAIFCHGGSTTAFLSRVLNIPFPHLCASFHLKHTGIVILRFDTTPGIRSIPLVELAGDILHIKEHKSE